MLSLKKIFLVSKGEYVRWLVNPRAVLLFVIWIFISNCALVPLSECADTMQMKLNIFEPFIAVGNSPLLMLILPLGYITLMADFPRTNRNALSVVSRCGRLNWGLGQLLFSVYAAITYCTVLLITSTLPLAAKSFIGNEWSDAVRLYGYFFPDRAGSAVTSLLPKNLYNQLSPFHAVLNTFLLMLLCLLTLSAVMLLLRLIGYKKLGFFAACALIAAGAALTGISSPTMWATPIGNAILWKHFTEYYREPVFALPLSYLYFAVFIAALVIGSIAATHKISFEMVLEDD